MELKRKTYSPISEILSADETGEKTIILSFWAVCPTAKVAEEQIGPIIRCTLFTALSFLYAETAFCKGRMKYVTV